VFILKPLLGAEKALGLRRQELGIRIPDHDVPLALIKTLGCPLYSITAKHSMAGTEWDNTGAESPTDDEPLPIREEELFEGGWELEAIEGIDCILDGGEDRERVFSTILDLSGDEVKLLRQGTGPWPA
jgi:tRNA A37 threonylcarbamoyladenosine synthetase subunit TsaC/SUA5/YrdC